MRSIFGDERLDKQLVKMKETIGFALFSVTILCVSGLPYFNRMEHTFADLA